MFDITTNSVLQDIRSWGASDPANKIRQNNQKLWASLLSYLIKSLTLMIRRFSSRLMRYLRNFQQTKLLRAGDRRSSATFPVLISAEALQKLIGYDRSFIIAPSSPSSSEADLYLKNTCEGLSHCDFSPSSQHCLTLCVFVNFDSLWFNASTETDTDRRDETLFSPTILLL